MKSKKIGGLFAAFTAFVLISACTGGLPSSMRREIAYEHDRLSDAKQQVKQEQQNVEREVAGNADLFGAAPVPAEWKGKFEAIDRELSEADKLDRELTDLSGKGRVHGPELDGAESELGRERVLRESAAADARAISDQAAQWVNFKADLPSHLDAMRHDYDAVHSADLKPVEAKLSQAEKDWPAKKDALDGGLVSLHDIQTSADKLWNGTEQARSDATAGHASGAELATLIAASDELAKDQSRLSGQSIEWSNRSDQLYDSWDKILTDLDTSGGHEHEYREKIKTVRTHFEDVSTKKAETTSSENWVDISESGFHAVENDIGMALEHKDVGLFDDEAQKTPEPAGFAYIAPETQPGNQYGYWDHSSGHSVWAWLPEYLILRELLWNHSYRPVVIDEYRGYQTAQRGHQTYYGRETPASAPKYGTHGTFTQTHYAASRYVQSGGFKGSAYASRGNGMFSGNHAPATELHRSPAFGGGTEGHRFGRSASPSSGRQFGQSKAFRGLGRSFGRRR